MGSVSLPAIALIAVVCAQRLLELRLAELNTARLLGRGGREVGEDHYPLIVVLHAGWIISLVTFGWSNPLVWPWVAAYAGLQVFRAWILLSLGERWTTRIIIVDEPLVRRGPYRFMPHPNYLLVFLELIVVPLALDLPLLALLFGILNGTVLMVRIGVEDRALRSR